MPTPSLKKTSRTLSYNSETKVTIDKRADTCPSSGKTQHPITHVWWGIKFESGPLFPFDFLVNVLCRNNLITCTVLHAAEVQEKSKVFL